MASLDLTRLLNNARVHLPGAIDSNIQLELFNVLNDFFQGSNIWQEAITFQVKAADVLGATYSIENQSVASMVRLISLINSASLPVSATMAVPGDIILNTQVTNADTLTATVSLTVNDPTTKEGYPEFPAWTLNKYGTGILDGLIGRMMMQPAKPWTNSQLAIFRTRRFNGVVSQAKFEALHKSLNNGQTWRFPQSFNARRGR